MFLHKAVFVDSFHQSMLFSTTDEIGKRCYTKSIASALFYPTIIKIYVCLQLLYLNLRILIKQGMQFKSFGRNKVSYCAIHQLSSYFCNKESSVSEYTPVVGGKR